MYIEYEVIKNDDSKTNKEYLYGFQIESYQFNEDEIRFRSVGDLNVLIFNEEGITTTFRRNENEKEETMHPEGFYIIDSSDKIKFFFKDEFELFKENMESKRQ